MPGQSASSNNTDDPRRPEKIRRYKAPSQTEASGISEHVNAVGMVFSLVGLLLRVNDFFKIFL